MNIVVYCVAGLLVGVWLQSIALLAVCALITTSPNMHIGAFVLLMFAISTG
jgi:hypothetical protein